jgi:hypothetical protein
MNSKTWKPPDDPDPSAIVDGAVDDTRDASYERAPA